MMPLCNYHCPFFIRKHINQTNADVRLLKYQPSVVAVSALWCSLDELIASSCAHIAFITRLFNQEQKVYTYVQVPLKP